MRNFLRIADGLDVAPALHAIQRQPDLWNADAIRTTFPGSPHSEVDDILLRFEEIDCAPDDPDLAAKLERAPRTWRPAWQRLPEVRGVILNLMHRVAAYELARVMVTRLRPGGRIAAHADTKGAYANLPDIGRYHIVLQGLPGSLFAADGETVNMRTGELWWFNAHATHEVVNNSADDRIHLLVDLRLI